MKARISMISLAVADLDRSIAFYRDGLGLPLQPSPPGVAFFALNGSWLGLSPRDSLARDAGLSSAGSGFQGFTLSHNVSDEATVTSVFSQAISAGACSIKSPTKAEWGGFHGYFGDPDGHLWEIAYNPFMWVGPEDQ